MAGPFKRVDTGTSQVAYIESGAGEPLILLHGGEGFKHQYDIFMPLLGDGIRAIAYDQRDTADTINDESDYTMATLAAECAGLIKGLGYEKAHILGISLGGGIALNLAINHPEVVQSLILGSTKPDFKAAEGAYGNLKDKTPEEREQFMISCVLSDEGMKDEGLLADLRSAIYRRGLEPHQRRLAAILTHDVNETAKTITAPTLVLHGSDDQMAKVECGYWLAEHIPGARLEVFPGLRHGISIEKRANTAKWVRDWVLSHPMNG